MLIPIAYCAGADEGAIMSGWTFSGTQLGIPPCALVLPGSPISSCVRLTRAAASQFALDTDEMSDADRA